MEQIPPLTRMNWIDEVDRLVLDVPAQDGEVVAVIELILFHCGEIVARIALRRNLVVWCGFFRHSGAGLYSP